MSKNNGIKKSSGDGFDRIQWLTADGVTRSLRADDAAAASLIIPSERTRRPGKYQGQQAYQGHYWCAGTERLVFHESMAEYSGIMLLDHLHDIVGIYAQPLLLTFGDGTFHYPDYLVDDADGTRMLVDIHPKSLTTEAHERAFEATRRLCERLGWSFVLIDELSRVVRWNLELLARYHHPRFRPEPDAHRRIIKLARLHPTLGALMSALETNKPGENIPHLLHLMWQRQLLIDLTQPITGRTPITPA